MNEKFFSLPEEKQRAIINAGYHVFSQNSYKNSPMSEIAEAAGISKSLLFHYFHNKMELYLFLWDKCAETTIEFMTKYDCYSQCELFESMERGMQAKMEIIRLYPDMGSFTSRSSACWAVSASRRLRRVSGSMPSAFIPCWTMLARSNSSSPILCPA